MGAMNVEEGKTREAFETDLGQGRQNRIPNSLRTDLVLLIRYHDKQSNAIQRLSRSFMSVTR
jgi:hypothetical protein